MRSFTAVVVVATLAPATAFAQARMVINEFVANPASTDTGKEWVELYNAGNQEQNLDGWKLRTATSLEKKATYSTKVTFDNTHVVPASAYFVICETDGNCPVTADLLDSLSLPNGTGGDGLQLTLADDTPVDTVAYGDASNGDLIEEDTGSVATNLAPKPGDDQAIARRHDGVDTQVSGADFWIPPSTSPGAANPAPPPCEATAEPPTVLINEFLANPDGADAGYEWVELYNSDSAEVKVEGWSILVASSGDNYNVKATISAGKAIAADSYFLIGESLVPGTDEQVDGNIAMGSGLRADGVRLVDCEGTIVDTVVFGDEGNEDLVIDDSGSAATSVAPKPGDGASLARKENGVDTDLSGDDFILSNDPTPGAANPVFQCFPSTGDVLLNEVLPDPDGSDDDAMMEWVELYNVGSAALQIDGWQIVAAGKPDDVAVDVVVPPNSTIAAGDFFVIGRANVAEADYSTEFSIGNGSDGDAVRLLDCQGNLVDVIVYGSNNDDGMLDESGAVASPAPNPGGNQSLARNEDGVDSDDPGDWFVDVSPTPGETNYQEIPDIPDDESEGCGKDEAPTGDDPGGCGSSDQSGEGGCSTIPLPFGGMELLLGVVVALRRRRSDPR
jgi:hypothetical protein